MTDRKWTPGPWENDGEDESEGIPFIQISALPPHGFVCRVDPTLDDDENFVISDETRATGDLIAAAPDLFAALEEVALLLSNIGRGDRVVAAVTKARRALAKALGEPSP